MTHIYLEKINQHYSAMDKNKYMKELVKRYMNKNNLEITHQLRSGQLQRDIRESINTKKERKETLHNRSREHISDQLFGVSVMGIRTDTTWRFYSMRVFGVSSRRTGFKRFRKGRSAFSWNFEIEAIPSWEG